MAFRIQDLSIHLSSDTGDGDYAKNEGPPCTMMSGDPEKCREISLPDVPPCREKTERPKKEPRGGPRGGRSGEKKGLAFLQARLREALAPPPL